MKVVLSSRAIDNLAEIGEFIAQDNPARARSFVAELRRACRTLGSFPRRFPPAPRYGPDARRRVYKGYLIVFAVSDQVDVVTVVHGARDLDNLL